MSNVLVVSDYASKLLPFGESLKELLVAAFQEAQFEVDHVFYLEYKTMLPDKQYDYILIVASPERYEYIRSKLKYSSKYILWSLEPIDTGNIYADKFSNRRNYILNCISGDTYQVWLHYDEYVKFFNNDKIKYMPVGYNTCLEPRVFEKQIKERLFVLLGINNSYREKYIKLMRFELDRYAKPNIRAVFKSYDKFISAKETKDFVKSFKIGVDLVGYEDLPNIPRWHRIMFYTACRVVLVSNSDLSQYGFINGQHYFYFNSPKELALTLDKLFVDRNLSATTINNMRQKISQEYNMSNLIKKVLHA